MKPVEPREQDQGEPLCPKRLWVLTVLSDDEQIDPDDALPQGLRFHLLRCPSCRALADRLQAVSASLRELAELQPDATLADRAGDQAIAALRSGAKLTGRVNIPVELELEIPRPDPALWWRVGRVAAAASIVLAVTILGVMHRWGPPQPTIVDERPVPLLESTRPATTAEPIDTPEPPPDASPGRFAEAHHPGEASRAVSYPMRRHHSHIEAALSDEPGGFQRAIVLPDPATRRFGWVSLFDRPARVESTKPLHDEH